MVALPFMRADAAEELTEGREFVRVRPSTERLDPHTAETLLTKLHALSPTGDGGGRGGHTRPTVEMYLVSPAGRHCVDCCSPSTAGASRASTGSSTPTSRRGTQ